MNKYFTNFVLLQSGLERARMIVVAGCGSRFFFHFLAFFCFSQSFASCDLCLWWTATLNTEQWAQHTQTTELHKWEKNWHSDDGEILKLFHSRQSDEIKKRKKNSVLQHIYHTASQKKEINFKCKQRIKPIFKKYCVWCGRFLYACALEFPAPPIWNGRIFSVSTFRARIFLHFIRLANSLKVSFWTNESNYREAILILHYEAFFL